MDARSCVFRKHSCQFLHQWRDDVQFPMVRLPLGHWRGAGKADTNSCYLPDWGFNWKSCPVIPDLMKPLNGANLAARVVKACGFEDGHLSQWKRGLALKSDWPRGIVVVLRTDSLRLKLVVDRQLITEVSF